MGQGVLEALLSSSGEVASRQSQDGVAPGPSVLQHFEVKAANAEVTGSPRPFRSHRASWRRGQELDLAHAAQPMGGWPLTEPTRYGQSWRRPLPQQGPQQQRRAQMQ